MKDISSNPVLASLEEAWDQFESKNATHGETWKDFGKVMMAIGLRVHPESDEDDWNRLGVFVQIVHKVLRYGKTFHHGGCKNSSSDLVTYAAMLDALTKESQVNVYRVMKEEPIELLKRDE